jgi:peptide/nickel transport system permease protein
MGDGGRGRGLLIAGATLVAAIVLLALLAPYLTPYDPDVTVVARYTGPAPPSAAHPLGTDTLGRDVWARIVFGARTSLAVAVLAMLVSLGIGVTVGLVAGYFGRWLDTACMWIVDLVLTLPTLLLLIVLATVLPPSLLTIPLVIGLVGWTTFARTVRGEVLSLRERDYVLAARALGASHAWIIVRHLLPGALPSVLALAALGMSGAIGLDAGLSYLGLGVPLPTPSWGRMISETQTYFAVAPWLVVVPGVAISAAVIGFNLIGYGLLDLLGAPRT